MKLSDSHCHLDDSQFDDDRQNVIERAREAGVDCMLAIGTGDGPPDLSAAVRLAERWPSIYATVGVHPNDSAKVENRTFENLITLLGHPKVKAVGEIGLDYYWKVAKEAQIDVFQRQLKIAAQARKPVVIHTRDAWDDTLAVLRSSWASTGLPCILHCFTGTWEQARTCLDLGFYLAFGGITTFPKSHHVREAARQTPSDRLLLETDAPYLAPLPHRGRRNEPAYIAHTAKVIADLRGLPPEELAEQTTGNFRRVLSI